MTQAQHRTAWSLRHRPSRCLTKTALPWSTATEQPSHRRRLAGTSAATSLAAAETAAASAPGCLRRNADRWFDVRTVCCVPGNISTDCIFETFLLSDCAAQSGSGPPLQLLHVFRSSDCLCISVPRMCSTPRCRWLSVQVGLAADSVAILETRLHCYLLLLVPNWPSHQCHVLDETHESACRIFLVCSARVPIVRPKVQHPHCTLK